ncbi:MAG TPA: AAA family ATPase [Granulicella sp.]
MFTQNNNPGIFSTVLLTVCVPPEEAERLTEAVSRMLWRVSVSHFEGYISAARRPSMGAEMRSADLCIAVVDFDRNPEMAAESAQYLAQLLSGKITIVALSRSQDSALLLAAMRAGCTEMLYRPLNESTVTQISDRIAQLSAAPTQRSSPGGSILTFLGAKGGVGTTTLAIHLAVYLAQCHQKRVLLIDSQPELGHVCVYLRLDGSRYHFQELVRNVSRLDSELLQCFVANHPSGLKVLSSPDTCGGMKTMSPEAVTRTLHFLKSEYDYVIVDAPMSFEESNLPVMQASSTIYLVATQEFAAIRDLSRGVDRLLQEEGAQSRLQIVINRFTSTNIINAEQIEKAIKLPIHHCIAENGAELIRATNMGETISSKCKSAFAGQLLKWTENLAGSQSQTAPAKKDKRLSPIWKRALLHTDA